MPYLHIETLKERRAICLLCSKFNKQNQSCSIDNKPINEKFFVGNCQLNKWPIKAHFEKEKPKKNQEKDPTLAKKAISFSISMYKWAVSGFLKAGKRQVHNRLSICQACEFWDGEAWNKTGRCKKCGCSTWAKIRLKTEKCPIGKW